MHATKFYQVTRCACGSWRRRQTTYSPSHSFSFVQCFDCFRWRIEEFIMDLEDPDVSRETLTPKGK